MQYTQNLKTENLEFRIPDFTTSKTRSSCSYASDFNQYTGTKEYQKDLREYVGISATYSGLFVDASFSDSFEYKNMKKTTSQSSTVLLESSADCELLSLEMPSFDLLELNSDFIAASMQALKGNKTEWLSLFDKFGTHFVTSTVLGGRMHLQQEMTSESYQELITMGVNIKAAASVSFAIISGKSDSETNINTQEKNAFENKIEKQKEIYLGGQPPKTKKWEDWYEYVQASPVPIYYKIKSISDLFTSRNFKNLSQTDLNLMKTKYLEFIVDFCNMSGCTVPIQDPSLPTTLRNNFEKTPEFGSNGYNNFDDLPFLIQKLKPTYKVSKIFIRFSNNYINSIQFALSDSVTTVYSPMRGSLENTLGTFVLEEEEFITQIEIWANDYVDSIRFITNRGRLSERFGPNKAGKYSMIMFKGQLVGVFGLSNGFFGSIGFIENIVDYKNLRNGSCPVLWNYFNGNCYFIGNAAKNFTNAKKDCESKNATILIVNSQIELDFIDNIIGNYEYLVGKCFFVFYIKKYKILFFNLVWYNCNSSIMVHKFRQYSNNPKVKINL